MRYVVRLEGAVGLRMGVGGGATCSWDSEGGGQRAENTPSSKPGQRVPNSASSGSLQIRELLETLPIVLLLLVLCAIDWALYSVFDTIRQHSFVQYSFRSEPGPRAWGQPPPASHTSSFLFCILSLCPL
jgi:hypothetical protein